MRNMIVSAGKLDDLSLCKRKFQLSAIMNLCSNQEGDRRNLDLGSLFHKNMEMHYTLKWDKIPLEDIIKLTMEFSRFYGKKETKLSDEDIELITRVYRDYALFYKNEGYLTDTLISEQPAVEVPFAKPLYEDESLRIILEGIIDWLATNSQNLEFVIDHKGTSSNYDIPILTNQFFAYRFATGRKYILVNKVSFKLEGSDEKRFTRNLFEISDRQVEEWIKNQVIYAKEILTREQENYYPQDFTSCNRFIKYPCEFLRVCQADPSFRANEISQWYKEKSSFNPLKDKESVRKYIEEMRK